MMPLEVLFELVAPDLDGAAQPYARDLPAAQAPVDPALAHTKLLTQLRDREQLHVALLVLFLVGAQGSFPGDAFLKLYEHALQFLEGLVVGL
jgi:hypothetical protein